MFVRAFKRPQDLKKHEKLHQEGGSKSESGGESRRGSSASARGELSNSGSGGALRVPQSMADLKRSKRSPSFSSAGSSETAVSPHPSPMHPPSPASDWSDPPALSPNSGVTSDFSDRSPQHYGTDDFNNNVQAEYRDRYTTASLRHPFNNMAPKGNDLVNRLSFSSPPDPAPMFDPYYARPEPETHGKRGTQALDQFVEDVKRNRIESVYNPDIGRRLDDMIPYLLDDPSPTDPDPFDSPENIGFFQDFLTELSENIATTLPRTSAPPSTTNTQDFDFNFGVTTGLGWDGKDAVGMDGTFGVSGGLDGGDLFGAQQQQQEVGAGGVLPSYDTSGVVAPLQNLDGLSDADLAAALGTELIPSIISQGMAPTAIPPHAYDDYSDELVSNREVGFTPAASLQERVREVPYTSTLMTIGANWKAPTTLPRPRSSSTPDVAPVPSYEEVLPKAKPTPTPTTTAPKPTATVSAPATPSCESASSRGRSPSLPTVREPPRPASADSVADLEAQLARIRLDHEKAAMAASPTMYTREDVDRIRHAQVVGALLRKIKGVVKEFKGKGRGL
ncbi:hypothetical protein HDV00_001182 [Rhizophlyctis rosea]|nr:hypothetical protein HDV00_001182 [Rhizophlyctis rosea]